MFSSKTGVKRHTWSLEARQRIIAEALAPVASIASVARRRGLNGNLIYKWLRRSREGWLDRRRAPMKEIAAAQTLVPLEVLELKPSLVGKGLAPLSLPKAKITAAPFGQKKRSVRRLRRRRATGGDHVYADRNRALQRRRSGSLARRRHRAHRRSPDQSHRRFAVVELATERAASRRRIKASGHSITLMNRLNPPIAQDFMRDGRALPG